MDNKIRGKFQKTLRIEGRASVGMTGEKGMDGKSAYEIWLDQGNEGTEEDFLESLRGPEGEQGLPGLDGKPAEVSFDEFPYMVQVSDILMEAGRYSSLEEAWNNQENFTVDENGVLTDYIEQDPHILDIVIPTNVKTIQDETFYTKNFKKKDYLSLVIPYGVTYIGEYAFEDWTINDFPLTIPETVTEIGMRAFAYWRANSFPLIIPENILNIGYNTFTNWENVPYIIMKSKVPPAITISTFNNQNEAPIYVPHSSVEDYKSASNWVSYFDRIKSINELVI